MQFSLNFQRTPVTIILLSVIGLLEALSLFDPEAFGRFFLYLGVTRQIWAWDLWRPFTTTLLHGDILHAVFNMAWLAVFGAALENWLGSGRFLALVIYLAYMSVLPSYVIEGPGIGFSGVNYGFFGLLLVGKRYRTDLANVCTPSTIQLMVVWFFLCILLAAIDVWNVANVAHGFGCLFGILLGKSIFNLQRRDLWRGITVAASLAVLLLLFWCPWNPGFKYQKRSPAPGRPLLQRSIEPEDFAVVS